MASLEWEKEDYWWLLSPAISIQSFVKAWCCGCALNGMLGVRRCQVPVDRRMADLVALCFKWSAGAALMDEVLVDYQPTVKRQQMAHAVSGSCSNTSSSNCFFVYATSASVKSNLIMWLIVVTEIYEQVSLYQHALQLPQYSNNDYYVGYTARVNWCGYKMTTYAKRDM